MPVAHRGCGPRDLGQARLAFRGEEEALSLAAGAVEAICRLDGTHDTKPRPERLVRVDDVVQFVVNKNPISLGCEDDEGMIIQGIGNDIKREFGGR